LHLLGELAQPALKVVGVTEEISESTAFHATNGSRPERRLGAAVDARPDSPARSGSRTYTGGLVDVPR
jgi:hypothetical protein